MPLRSSITVLLALALLLAALPGGAAVAADDEVGRRRLEDAASFQLATTAIVAAQGKRAGSTWKSLDKETSTVVENQIEWFKHARRQLARDTKRELDRYRGADEACERDVIQAAKRELDAELKQHLDQLRHLRGNHQKAFTRMHRSIQRNVLKPLGTLAQQALELSLPELAATYLSGGAFSRTVVRSVLKRNVVRVVRKKSQDLALRGLARKMWGPGATATDKALQEACVGKASIGPTSESGPGTQTAEGPVPAFAAGAWQLDLCTGSAQFSLEEFMPAPPYSQPYTLVRFDWPHKEAVMLNYFATSGDPAAKYPLYHGVMTAGCPSGLDWNNCAPAIPLVFTQAEEAMQGSADNRHNKPGLFTLAVEPKGACIYTNDNGDWDTSYPYPTNIEVTASIEHYRAGSTTPYAVEGPLRATVPFWVDDPFALSLPGPYRRVLGTFEWDPASSPNPDAIVGIGSDEPAPWDIEPTPNATATAAE